MMRMKIEKWIRVVMRFNKLVCNCWVVIIGISNIYNSFENKNVKKHRAYGV